MGSSFARYEPIISYYLFQKNLKNHINNNIIHREELNLTQLGYLISPQWVKEFKKRINYEKVEEILDKEDIDSLDALSSDQKDRIEKLFNEFVPNFEINKIVRRDVLYIYDILNAQNIELYIDKQTNDLMKLKKTSKMRIDYILKEHMIILCYRKHNMIKILVHSLYPFSTENKISNLTFYFKKDEDSYDIYKIIFEQHTSEELLRWFLMNDMFKEKNLIIKVNDKIGNMVNEELTKEYKDAIISDIKSKNWDQDIGVFKNPKNINFAIANSVSERGLITDEGTCYMNATLQCLSNVKPFTDYFLNKENYCYLFKNFDKCLLTLHYMQVLVGLHCDPSRKGSYDPIEFKKKIGRYNPLFLGVHDNNTKDLIIFLFEIINIELVKLYKIKNNIIEEKNEPLELIDTTDEKKVLAFFEKNFKKNNCSIVGDYFSGVKKSVYTCKKCSRITYNFNVFNVLIFNIERTCIGLTNNNSVVTVNLDTCFKYKLKEIEIQDTYCQKCDMLLLSKYREKIYSPQKYLIIIFDRELENMFKYNIKIPEKFDISDYIEIKSENNNYEIIGAISYFEDKEEEKEKKKEKEEIGHFVAFCKHNIDGKWRCYDNSIITECQNDFLDKINPYMVFYKKCENENSNEEKNNQEIKKSEAIPYQKQNMNPNSYNNNMGINNSFNNKSINQSMNTINPNNNFIRQNMMMNNSYNQNMINLYQQNMMRNNFNNFNKNVAMNVNNQNNFNNFMAMNYKSN